MANDHILRSSSCHPATVAGLDLEPHIMSVFRWDRQTSTAAATFLASDLPNLLGQTIGVTTKVQLRTVFDAKLHNSTASTGLTAIPAG
jgi:hypothetical protein